MTWNHPSFQPITTCRITHETNSGIDELARPAVTTVRSAIFPCLRAAKMPAAMLIGIVSTSAKAASLSERPNADPITSVTGLFWTYESPKSSVTTLFSIRTYCSINGSLVPSSSLIWSTTSCDWNGPASRRPTSLGKTLLIMNTIVTTSHKVTSENATRRSTYRVIGDQLLLSAITVCGSGHLEGFFHEDLAKCRHADPVELRRPSRDVVVEVRDHHRRVFEQDLLELRARRFLGIEPDRRLILRKGGVELGRRVLRRVPDAVRGECGVEIHVGRGAVPVVDDAELCGARARRLGRLGRAPLGPVEGVEALAGELEREAARRSLSLDQLRQLRDLLQVAEVQHCRDAVGEAGIGQQLLRHLGVVRALRDRGIEERVQRRDHVVVAHVRPALEQRVDQRLPIDAVAERLAD